MPYRSGISLFFHLSSNYAWAMGLHNPQWRHNPGQAFNLLYYIDNGPSIPVRATVTQTGMVSIPLADSKALFESFRRGNRLYVRDSRETFTFNLTNSSKALAATLECVQRYANSMAPPPAPYPYPPQPAPPYSSQPYGAPGAPSNPRAPGGTGDPGYPGVPGGPRAPTMPGAQPPAPRGPVAPEARGGDFKAEAATLAANIIASSGLPGVRVLAPDQVPPEAARFDAVWTADGGLIGMVHIVAGDGAATVDDVVASLTATDSKDCRGAFSSGRYPTDDTGVGRLVTLCSGSSAPEVQYTVIRRPAGGFFVIGVTGRGASSNAVLDAGSKLYDVALRSLAPR